MVIVEREKDGIVTGELRLRCKIVKYSPVEEKEATIWQYFSHMNPTYYPTEQDLCQKTKPSSLDNQFTTAAPCSENWLTPLLSA
jgi:hypothetical protein